MYKQVGKDGQLLWLLFCIFIIFFSIRILTTTFWGYTDTYSILASVFWPFGFPIANWTFDSFSGTAIGNIIATELVAAIINSIVIIVASAIIIISSYVLMSMILPSVNKKISFRTYALIGSLIVFLFTSYTVVSMTIYISNTMPLFFVDAGSSSIPFMTWVQFNEYTASRLWIYIIPYFLLNILRVVGCYILAKRIRSYHYRKIGG